MLAVIEQPSPVEYSGSDTISSGQKVSVEFDNVSFCYDTTRGNVLERVSFVVKPGETVALTGASGAGKTTCLNLLLRLWDVEQGAIRVGGQDIRAMSEDRLRALVAVVPQDIYLFNASILDNIRLARPDATEAEVKKAAKIAQIHDFIVNGLPSGYATVCGERGVELSGGQRQRIAIARAVLMDAPVLIMDEASSNLDSISEKAVATAMKQAAKGRTTILVAHRPSTIKSADREIRLPN